MPGIKDRLEAQGSIESDESKAPVTEPTTETEPEAPVEATTETEPEAPVEATTETEPEAPIEAAADPVDLRAETAEIIKLCSDSGVAELASVLVKEGASLEDAKGRIEAAADIREVVANARRINPAIDTRNAEDLILAGASVEHAKAVMLDKVVSMQSEDTVTARHSDSGGGAQVGGDPYGWGDVAKEVAKDYRRV